MGLEMIKQTCTAALCGLALAFAAPALAQNLSLRAPAWATPLIGADIISINGGRATLPAEGIDISVRVTIAPPRGGVARVIRYDQREDGASIFLRRFTGHPSTGWWLWGPDAPHVVAVTAAQRAEIAGLAQGAMGVSGALGVAGAGEACPAGEQAFVEVAVEGRATSFNRACVVAGDAVGRLSLRLSEFAGSRTEEELAGAAVAELMAADRAFNTMAQEEGVPAAFNTFAAEGALIVTSSEMFTGRAGIAAAYQDWPEGARLEWTPETARVSARGDMGWTWGNSVFVAPDGARRPGRYVSIWTRDVEGNWRFAFDAAIR